MPSTFNGIGTKYYGQRELADDGSFITTEWFVLAYIPIIPIGSFRVVPTGQSVNYLIYRSNQYLVRRVPLNWLQVRNVYITTVVILSTFLGVVWLLGETSSNTNSSKKSVPTQTASPSLSPSYVRPLTIYNGLPFPSTSGYISGYPQEFTDGNSSITIDNSNNDSDVFVKLFSLNTASSAPIRVFFIRAYDSFILENVSAGDYELRYRDLDSGALSRTDSFTLEEFKTTEGIQFSKLTLTLYKVSGGNMQIHTISEEEFYQ